MAYSKKSGHTSLAFLHISSIILDISSENSNELHYDVLREIYRCEVFEINSENLDIINRPFYYFFTTKI